ncbi:ras-related protein Rab-34-like [Oppia nitens]|uniref:ras-related protein Rab-34-like n=1 Tax=Oppia nitens TaxID=1686743 RepID=UPI0023DB279F|nr:ras-related protein Rab-34-like [Oppia nitens]XP_054162962.1 ras-related protein Rab-34-like [Oppia nitens]XP_054162963.1 ras-related protein Rab-34-like [Oppia nitens]XP_054162964.1 ras-related protein Rab-34-like [Oppia nitens]
MISPSHRVISDFMLPDDTASTPYNNLNFDTEVLELCHQELGTNQLRCAKCIVVGDIAVGKTCLINRFGYDVYANNYKATIGVDFDVQKFEIMKIPFNLQIWDTAGQERFKCITTTYYRGSHCAVIVFDLSNMSTLLSVEKWLQEVLDANSRADKPLVFLVGTKKDLLCDSAAQFVASQASIIANRLECEFWTVSAQTGENVNELFTRIACLVFNQLMANEAKAKRESQNSSQFSDISSRKSDKYANNFIKLTKKDKKLKKDFCVKFNCINK